MITIELLDTLASALSDIARGCKKLKSCVLKMKSSLENPGSESDDSSESQSVSQSVPVETPKKQEPPSILTTNFVEKAEIYFKNERVIVKNPKGKGKGPSTSQWFMEYVLERSVRQDKFKNTWVYNNKNLTRDNRKAWRKVSAAQAQTIYSNLRDGWLRFQSFFDTDKRPPQIHKSKWARRQHIIDLNLPETLWECKTFKKITNDLHETLPSFR